MADERLELLPRGRGNQVDNTYDLRAHQLRNPHQHDTSKNPFGLLNRVIVGSVPYRGLRSAVNNFFFLYALVILVNIIAFAVTGNPLASFAWLNAIASIGAVASGIYSGAVTYRANGSKFKRAPGEATYPGKIPLFNLTKFVDRALLSDSLAAFLEKTLKMNPSTGVLLANTVRVSGFVFLVQGVASNTLFTATLAQLGTTVAIGAGIAAGGQIVLMPITRAIYQAIRHWSENRVANRRDANFLTPAKVFEHGEYQYEKDTFAKTMYALGEGARVATSDAVLKFLPMIYWASLNNNTPEEQHASAMTFAALMATGRFVLTVAQHHPWRKFAEPEGLVRVDEHEDLEQPGCWSATTECFASIFRSSNSERRATEPSDVAPRRTVDFGGQYDHSRK